MALSQKKLGQDKGYGAGLCFCAGFFFGLIGLLIVAVLPKKDSSVEKLANADALMRYKGLLDAGAISQEEYDAKKKELLAPSKQ